MTVNQWLALVVICVLGAVTPGPSLIVIVRVALTSGRLEAWVAAWAHALAIGAYAALSLLFFTSAQTLGGPWFWLAVVGGQCWLLYMGSTMLWASRRAALPSDPSAQPLRARWYQGLMIGLINPKIWLFFTAVFSPFVVESNVTVTLALIPFLIDGLWYSLLVWGVTQGAMATWLDRIKRPLDAVLGLLLLALAIITLTDSLPNLVAAV